MTQLSKVLKQSDQMDRFGAIKEMALSSTETISISRQDDRGKQDKLTLGAPQPKKGKGFFKKAKYDLSDDGIREHLESNVEKLADYLGVENDQTSIEKSTIDGYRMDLALRGIQRQDMALTKAAIEGINKKDFCKDNYPVKLAVNKRNPELLQAVLEKGQGEFDVNMPLSSNDTTPLMMACRQYDAKSVKLLLKEGADVTLANKSGKTALDFANSPDISKLLEEAKNQTSQTKSSEKDTSEKQKTSEPLHNKSEGLRSQLDTITGKSTKKNLNIEQMSSSKASDPKSPTPTPSSEVTQDKGRM